MSSHKLKYGKKIISFLKKIGDVLNYHVELEVAVEDNNSSAVDVGFFYEENQKYPLMIFEIESTVSNSMAANPLKVFSQSNKYFEKPLFFFHIILTGGKKSSKINQLEDQYGKFNYRVYIFALDQQTQLIKDILSQQRRLTCNLNIVDLLLIIENEMDNIKLDELIVHIEKCKFENTGSILQSYAQLSYHNTLFYKYFFDYLKAKYHQNEIRSLEYAYNNYWASWYGYPVQLGIMTIMESDPNIKKDYFYEFIWWQEQSTYLKYISPNFGLSREYDIFLLGFSGAYLTMVSLLFHQVEVAHKYISKVLDEIVTKSHRYGFSIFSYNALWLLYLSAQNTNTVSIFNRTSDLINENGGLSKNLYKKPPSSIVSIINENDETYFNDIQKDKADVPDIVYFENKLNLNDPDLLKIAFEFLIDYEMHNKINDYLII